MEERKRRIRIQPIVSPAGQRRDQKRPGNVPCPNEESLREAHRWQEEHIQ